MAVVPAVVDSYVLRYRFMYGHALVCLTLVRSFEVGLQGFDEEILRMFLRTMTVSSHSVWL